MFASPVPYEEHHVRIHDTTHTKESNFAMGELRSVRTKSDQFALLVSSVEPFAALVAV